MRYLIVVYSPYDGYLPKRMDELYQRYSKGKELENIKLVVCYPSDFEEKLSALETDVVELIELTPDNSTSPDVAINWWNNVQRVREICQSLKSFNM